MCCRNIHEKSVWGWGGMTGEERFYSYVLGFFRIFFCVYG